MSLPRPDMPECPLCEERCEWHCDVDRPGGCGWAYCGPCRVQGIHDAAEDEWGWMELTHLPT